tara:strand:- start:197 stop:1081 length:885 start_codon:yes stop_codon:yes gene_type:complete
MNRNFKINFVTFSQFPQYMDYIGSSNVSHTLAKELSLLGENSFIYSNSTPHKEISCIPWGSELDYDNENTIFILPAGAGDHTFTHDIPDFIHKSKNIVRHLVNYQVKPYPKENKLYRLSPYFDTLKEQKIDGYMPMLTIDFDLFKNNNVPRSGRCYLIKGNEYIENQPKFHTNSDTNLDDYFRHGKDKFKYLAEMFNKHEVFFCYNTQTFICNLAALCGCKVVIIPHPKTSREKIMKFPQNKYGIAYGFDDIQHSIDTLHLVEANLKDCLLLNKFHLKQFVNDSYKWLETKYNL